MRAVPKTRQDQHCLFEPEAALLLADLIAALLYLGGPRELPAGTSWAMHHVLREAQAAARNLRNDRALGRIGRALTQLQFSDDLAGGLRVSGGEGALDLLRGKGLLVPQGDGWVFAAQDDQALRVVVRGLTSCELSVLTDAADRWRSLSEQSRKAQLRT